MMHVDDDALEAFLLQLHHHMPQQGLAGYRNQGLGHGVGKGAEPGS